MSILKDLKTLLSKRKDSITVESRQNLERDSSEGEMTPKKETAIKIEVADDKMSSSNFVEKSKEVEFARPSPKKVEKVKEEFKKVQTEPKEVKEVQTEDMIDEEIQDNDLKNKKEDNMTLLTDTELLNDSNRDKEFTAEFIDAGIETVKHCFQCGTCSGGCPSGRKTPYKVRQIVRKCLLGLKEEVITDDALWMCTTCYTCQERCPRSVVIVDIIKKARNVAAHAGYMAKPHKMTGVFVMNTGHGVPINDATKALRSKIGLDEIPPTTHSFPEALDEIKTICKITGFDDLIGYDESTGGLKE